MSSDLLVLLLLVLVVLLGSALCSGVEAALLTVNPIRVHELSARDRPVAGARRLAQLRKRLGRTLSALVIANNGFNIFGSLMLGGYAAWVFEQRNISGASDAFAPTIFPRTFAKFCKSKSRRLCRSALRPCRPEA